MTAPLIIVPPVDITDAMLDYTDVGETEHPAWAVGTPYGLNDRVIRSHKVWQSLQASNVGHVPETSTDWWALVGPSNAWALFDRSNSTQTKKPTSMTYRLKPVQAVTALALLNVDGCNSARVKVSHPSYGLIKGTTYGLASEPIDTGWWAWTFGERVAPTELVIQDLPPLPGCTIEVVLAGTTDLAVGVLLVGAVKSVGEGVLQGMKLGIKDYSRKETDDFGETVLVRRGFANTTSFTVPIRTPQLPAARALLSSLRATPCLWITPAAVVYGFYQDFEILLAYTSVAECSITVEGLT